MMCYHLNNMYLHDDIVAAVLSQLLQLDIPRAELIELISLNRVFQYALQPFLFRHINFRTFMDAFSFLHLIEESQVPLARGIRTLQISMDLDTNIEDPAYLEQCTAFWGAWLTLSSKMTALHTLVICYEIQDDECLERFLIQGHLDQIPSLRKLHLMPIKEQATFREENDDRPDDGPWSGDTWQASLCSPKLGNITDIIISTSAYPFWPPTWKEARQLWLHWFGHLPPASPLRRVVLHCGYADECERVDEYADANDQTDGDESVPRGLTGWYDTRIDGSPHVIGDGYHPTLVWTKNRANRDWEEDGDAYCGFGEHLYFESSRVGPPSRCEYGHEAVLFRRRALNY
ncbi:hypothetical protein FB451DRAFT_1566870 [Mycena latifolia]|nr:hypothetical protein FB451DRAFT_1566870 [Mycena latifolia]